MSQACILCWYCLLLMLMLLFVTLKTALDVWLKPKALTPSDYGLNMCRISIWNSRAAAAAATCRAFVACCEYQRVLM